MLCFTGAWMVSPSLSFQRTSFHNYLIVYYYLIVYNYLFNVYPYTFLPVSQFWTISFSLNETRPIALYVQVMLSHKRCLTGTAAWRAVRSSTTELTWSRTGCCSLVSVLSRTEWWASCNSTVLSARHHSPSTGMQQLSHSSRYQMEFLPSPIP